MNNLPILSEYFDDGDPISIRVSDGYWNATEMCQRQGRLFADFCRLKSTKSYLEVLSLKTGRSADRLLVTSPGRGVHSWVHPELGAKLVEWLKDAKEKDASVLRESSSPSSLVAWEKRYQLEILKKEGGSIEVKCPAGYIDNVTSSEIIEVKDGKDWKNAIGQVLVYSKYFPSHKKRIHLFGVESPSVKQMIESHALDFGIRVTWS